MVDKNAAMAGAIIEELKSAILGLDMEAAVAHVRTILGGDAGAAPEAVNAVTAALAVVGKRFQDGEWFVGELVYAGEIAKAAMALLTPRLAAGAAPRRGTVVVGTVAGDLHDLGKNIFLTYARSSGFEVVDLGTDVRTEAFIAAVKTHRPLALGLSCLLTITAGEVGTVIAALEQHGLRDTVKVIIGGAALTKRFAGEIGADAFAPDAVTGTDIIKTWSAA